MGDSGRENPRSLHSNFLNCNSHNDLILVLDPHTCHIWYSLCAGCPIKESKFISQRCHGWSHRVQFSWSVQPLCKYNRASKKFWESWVSNVGTAGFWSVFSLLRYYNLGPPWCSVVKKKKKKEICLPMQEMWVWFPGLGRSPGEGNGNLLQYSCLRNPMNREACQATVHGVAKNQTQLSDWTCTLSCFKTCYRS